MSTEFQVLWGVNNIYTLLDSNLGLQYEAFIKGKILTTNEKEYSPLVPGDFVRGEIYDTNKVYIEDRISRNNVLWRYNKKAGVRQVISANLDNILIVNSANIPEVKNSFIDRALVVADEEGINPIIVINKVDEGVSERTKDLVSIYKSLGYVIFLTSAKTCEGISELKNYIRDSRTSFLGQSGVGKSSLINLINVGASQKISEISNRYKRGKHTTVYAIAYPNPEGVIIDTPGIKEFGIETLDSSSLKYRFREFKDLNNLCKFNSCLHENEPNCAVIFELNKKVNEIRYKSYLKILGELKKYK